MPIPKSEIRNPALAAAPKGAKSEILPFAWRVSGASYLACLLASFALGLWPQAVDPRLSGAAVLPTLRGVALGQVFFILLVYPLCAAWRAQRRSRQDAALPANVATSPWTSAARIALEWLGYAIVSVPFYLAGCWFADATAQDAFRTALAVAAFLPAGMIAACWMHRPAARPIVLLLALLALFAAPAACYVILEFLPRFKATAAAVWAFAPLTFTWDAANSRGDRWLPQPAWSILFWLGLTAAAGFLRLAIGRRRKEEG